jgi:hypothetical protein
MADGIVQVQPDSSGKKVDTSELTVNAQTVERQRVVLSDDATAAGLAKVMNVAPSGTEYGLITRNIEDVPPFMGRAGTFRTPGRAGTTGQKLLSIHNATGSSVQVFVDGITVDLVQTVIKAVTVIPPIVRLWAVTVLPTNGTALTKNKVGGVGSTSSSVTVLGDASADGTNSGTALTATLPAGTILTQEFAPRFVTAAGYEMADRIEFLGSTPITLGALQGLVLFLDYTVATANPTTDMWVATVSWSEQ